MNSVLKEQDYKKIFHYFTEISAVPRGSRNNTAISKYLINFAVEHNLEYYTDEFENVIIIKEATKGYEDAPTIMLQGHMDMVCEKANDSTHDFLTEGIELLVTDDFIHADRTTLGADNGIAVAYSLALLSDETLQHPRIEVLITTDEEVGMEGAIGMDVSKLKGKYLLNVDSGDEGTILISSAGGLTGTATIPVKRVETKGLEVQVAISNLKGGHSGAEIHQNRTNANKLMGRLLFALREEAEFLVLHMEGGLKDNAIPRDSVAALVIQPDAYSELEEVVSKLAEEYTNELKSSEPSLTITLSKKEEGTYSSVHPASFEKVLFMLLNTPNGVQVMSSDIKGLVESSLNLGIFTVKEEEAVFCFSVRSSVNSYKQHISQRLAYFAEFLGGEYIVRGQYPAWEYKKESDLRTHLSKIYKEMYGTEPGLEAIHAGLECGFFAAKIPGVDIVSLGPTMYDIHTPEERLSISSSIRVYQYLEKVIEGMKDMVK